MRFKERKVGKIDKILVVEVLIFIYIIITTLVNILNVLGIINFTTFFMQPTFYGPSLLIILLLQFYLIPINRTITFLVNIRPYIMGIVLANVVSTGRLPFCLLLIVIVVYCFWFGMKRKYSKKKAGLVICSAALGIEAYSVLFVLKGVNVGGSLDGFMKSAVPDAFLLFVFFIQGCITYLDKNHNISLKEEGLYHNILVKLKKLYNWCMLKHKHIINYICSIVCVIAFGIFMVYAITISTGEDRVFNSKEEVYLLQHSENISLVLTLMESKEGNKLEFCEYIGTNNQKIQIVDVGDGRFRYVFLEPRLAIEVGISEETGEKVINLSEESDKEEQKWNKGFWLGIDNFEMVTRITNAEDIPIYYQTLAQSDGIPQVGIGIESGGHEYMPMERTISNEFITKTIAAYKEDFQPTEMISINIERFNWGSYILFFLIALVFCTIIYARRIVGDKYGLLNAVMFGFLLAYGAISVIVLFLLVFGLQCYLGFVTNRKRVISER